MKCCFFKGKHNFADSIVCWLGKNKDTVQISWIYFLKAKQFLSSFSFSNNRVYLCPQ